MRVQCTKCEERGMSFIQYHDGYDAYYCGICGSWLEPKCDDSDCDVCVGRPDKMNLDDEV